MDYYQLINGMKRYGSTERDICLLSIGIAPDLIEENVVLAPWWEPSVLPDLGKAEYLSESASSPVKVWRIITNSLKFTYIKTGIGASVLMDVVLSLGLTKCRNILFIGSAGALDKSIGIGDIVIPEYSVCGDGASRYIASDDIKHDSWGEKVYPDSELLTTVKSIIESICKQNNINWHLGRNFSIDSIFAEYAHLDTIINMKCNTIEMETAAAFRAAKTASIKIAAVFSISDNTITEKSLLNGRTEQEINYRRYVRRNIFPQIIINIFNMFL